MIDQITMERELRLINYDYWRSRALGRGWMVVLLFALWSISSFWIGDQVSGGVLIVGLVLSLLRVIGLHRRD